MSVPLPEALLPLEEEDADRDVLFPRDKAREMGLEGGSNARLTSQDSLRGHCWRRNPHMDVREAERRV